MTAQIRLQLAQAAAAGSAEDMVQAAAAALQAGVFAEALSPLEAALRHHPSHPQLWHLLALIRRNLAEHDGALEAFNKAAKLAPGDAAIVHGLACETFEAGLPAVRLFERAMRLAPGDRSILRRYAAALIAQGRRDEAIAALDRETRRTPLWLEGQAALARVRWLAGEREHFAQGFERAVKAVPRDPGLWRAYVQTLLHDGLYERALAVVARARAAVGPDSAFDAAEAIALTELGDLAGAEPLFARLAPLREVTVIVAFLRFLLRAGRVPQAAEIAARSAPNDPSFSIWPYAALAWRLLGDPRWEVLEGDPRFVGVYDIADRLPPLDQLAERLRGLHGMGHHPLYQSVRGGTQTEGHLFQRADPLIRGLRQAVVEAVEKHVAQLPQPRPGHPLLIAKRAPIGFAGSWSVRLAGGGHHVDHVHPSGWLSSALYIALPEDPSQGADEAGWLTLGQARDLAPALGPIRTIEPKPGRLVLFPSTMWHGTRPFAAGERLTVAFDVKRPAEGA
jgi:Tfp pilus assembly protein PilF